jgi:ATP-binding cassette, subfamily C, bacterial LapB
MTSSDQLGSQSAALSLADPDYLLECVQDVAGHYGRSAAATVLTAGLPLQNGLLTLQLVPKAAQRVGLEAELVHTRLADLVPLDLPAIVQMTGGYPAVLRGGNAQTGYIVYLPWQKAEFTVEPGEFEAQYSGYAVRIKPIYRAPDDEHATRPPVPGSWFWSVVRQYRRNYSIVIVAAVVINLIALATPLFFMNVYDRVIPNKAMETLWVFVVGLTVAMTFDLLLKIARGQIIDRVGRKVDIQVACNLIEKILNTRLVDRPSSTGALANRIQEYEIIREFFSSTTLMLFVDMAFFFLFSAIIFLLAGWVVVVPLTALAIVIALSFLMQARLSAVVRQAQDESALRHSILVESISSLETIKSIRAEGHILQRWEKYARAAAESSEKAKYLSSLGLNVTGFIQQLVTIGVVVAGVYRFSDGAMSMGAIIAVVMLSNRLVSPLSQIAMMFSRLHYVRLAFRHFDEIMAKGDDRPVQAGFVNRQIERGQVQFCNVEFTYPGATSPILRNLNLMIRPGERIGIIGKIGSGKTTIGRLLTGLYQPEKGEILVDGVDLRQYHPHEIRSAIALVVQDADLFIGSVRDNIVMAKPTARDEEIVWAAKLAGVDAFVASNPRGYDMSVGERGSLLSGGQRQCVALARVFLANPRILFLDEPSSSMDLQTERQFIERLESAVRPDQTLLIATHRQSMLKLVNRLLVVDAGQIVRDGPKDEVLKSLADGAAARAAAVQQVPPAAVVRSR